MNGEATIEKGLAVYRLKPEESECQSHFMPNLSSFSQKAEECLLTQINIEIEDYKKDNQAMYEIEKNRIIKSNDYRSLAEQKKIETIDSSISYYRSWGTKEQKKIIPIWKKEIKDHQASIDRWEKNRDEKLKELENKKAAGYSYNIFSAALIEFIE